MLFLVYILNQKQIRERTNFNKGIQITNTHEQVIGQLQSQEKTIQQAFTIKIMTVIRLIMS